MIITFFPITLIGSFNLYFGLVYSWSLDTLTCLLTGLLVGTLALGLLFTTGISTL